MALARHLMALLLLLKVRLVVTSGIAQLVEHWASNWKIAKSWFSSNAVHEKDTQGFLGTKQSIHCGGPANRTILYWIGMTTQSTFVHMREEIIWYINFAIFILGSIKK